MQVEMQPCKCGNLPVYYEEKQPGGSIHHIYCKNCRGYSVSSVISKAFCIEKWNQRMQKLTQKKTEKIKKWR